MSENKKKKKRRLHKFLGSWINLSHLTLLGCWRREGGGGRVVHSQGQQRDILFEPPNAISSNKKGETFHIGLTQKRSKDIDHHPGPRPRPERKASWEPLGGRLKKKLHLKYVIKAEGWWKVLSSLSKRPSQCAGYKSLKCYFQKGSSSCSFFWTELWAAEMEVIQKQSLFYKSN